jgi:selenium metabolism protein YedF
MSIKIAVKKYLVFMVFKYGSKLKVFDHLEILCNHFNFFFNFAGYIIIKMKIIDTRGQLCPAPLIATRKALKEVSEGEVFEVLTDNKTSLDNISRYLRDNKIFFSVREDQGTWTINVTGGNSNRLLPDAAQYCAPDVPHFTKGNFIVVFSSEIMGQGDDELGRLLTSNFIKAVRDLDSLPQKMIFYNSGVKLGSNDSQVFQSLSELEKMGVTLLFCATCAKFYSLEEKITIGTLSNMFEIAQSMASASNIIRP